MAHIGIKLHRGSQASSDEVAHKQLEIEKVGVIVGFLAGLPLAVGTVSETLSAHGVADWLVGVAMVLTLAVSTAAGLRIGSAIATRIGQRR